MRVLIIGNPIAGVGRAGRRVGELARLLRDRGCEVTTRLTRGPGDARASPKASAATWIAW